MFSLSPQEIQNIREYDYAILTESDLETLTKTSPNKCFICDRIINKCLNKTDNEEFYIHIDLLDDSELEHLQQVINRKILDGNLDVLTINDRYSKNQF